MAPADAESRLLSIVVDTNVLAYLLIGPEPFESEVGELLSFQQEILAPSSWRIELANVLFLATSAGVIEAEEARQRMTLAEQLLDQTI